MPNRNKEYLIPLASQIAPTAIAPIFTNKVGEYITGKLLIAENLSVRELLKNVDLPLDNIYSHLTRLGEIHQRWTSTGVHVAQAFIFGLLATDSIVNETKPTTISGKAAEFTTKVAAMATPILVPELAHIVDNISHLEHMATSIGELAVIAAGVTRIGVAGKRLIQSYIEGKSHHEIAKRKLQSSHDPKVTKKYKSPKERLEEAQAKEKAAEKDRIRSGKRERRTRENAYLASQSQDKPEEPVISQDTNEPETKSIGSRVIQVLRHIANAEQVGSVLTQDEQEIPEFIKNRR